MTKKRKPNWSTVFVTSMAVSHLATQHSPKSNLTIKSFYDSSISIAMTTKPQELRARIRRTKAFSLTPDLTVEIDLMDSAYSKALRDQKATASDLIDFLKKQANPRRQASSSVTFDETFQSTHRAIEITEILRRPLTRLSQTAH